MDNDSIISLLTDDSDSSLVNDTYTAKNSTHYEDDSGICASVLKREFGEQSSIEPPGRTTVASTPRPGKSSTGSRAPSFSKELSDVTFKFFSPPVEYALPEIVVVPPSTERKRGRRSNRTPSKIRRYNFGVEKGRRPKSSLRTVPLVTVTEKEDDDADESSIDPFFSARSEVTIHVTSPSKCDDRKGECSFSFSGCDGTITIKSGSNHGGAVAKTKKSLGVKRLSGSLLSPREKTISRKSPNVASPIFSAKKLQAILTSTDFKVLKGSSVSPESSKIVMKKTVEVTAQRRIQAPRVFAKDLNTNTKPPPSVITTPTPKHRRTVAFVSPFANKTEKTTPSKSPTQTIIRGVRSNRRFDLMMKHLAGNK